MLLHKKRGRFLQHKSLENKIKSMKQKTNKETIILIIAFVVIAVAYVVVNLINNLKTIL